MTELRSSRRLVRPCLVLLYVAGCTTDGPDGSLEQAAAIVEWSVSAAPTLEFGGVDASPEASLHSVRGVVQFMDGRIAAVNAGTSEVKFFDSAGAHLETVGGRGDGPGDLSSPALVVSPRYDSIVVGGPFRISVVRANGTVERLAAVEYPRLPTAVLPDGSSTARSPRTGRRSRVPDRGGTSRRC